MAKRNRSQFRIQERTAKKRKQEDSLLKGGAFQDVPDDMDENSLSSAKGTSWDEEEQDYEMVPRKSRSDTSDLVEGLPIKVNGKVERTLHKAQEKPRKKEEDDFSDASEVDKSSDEEQDEEAKEEEPDTEEKIIQLKEDIADLVTKVMEEPEENTAALARLCKMVESKNPNTCKFSMLALVPLFKSIIPGYRIRPLSESEKKEKVSREVAKLRNFEHSLVFNYKNYVQRLQVLSKTPSNAAPVQVSLGILAAQAAKELISTASHFNFRTDIFTLLLRRICKPRISTDPISLQIIKTFETLLNEDEEGSISFEILRIFNKILKTRSFNIEESVLNILLSLDVLHDYDPNTKTEEGVRAPKLKKKDRVHLSKKQKKARKEMQQIEEEMRNAEQAVSAEEREKNQSEILKIVFTIYLNILKNNAKALIGSVLEGLTKFGNMANFDLLGDFLEVMKELISDTEFDNLSSDEVRKALLCIVSAFSLISNTQHMKVNMDLSKFVDGLYALLPYVCLDADIELSYKSLRLADPLNNEITKPSVNVSTKAELLLKALDHIFFRSRSGTKERATAFTKRLYTCIGHTPEKTSIAILKFTDKLMNRYPEISGLYSSEDRISNGHFIMEADNPSRSNANAATLWDNALLEKHYCPTVVKGLRSLSTRSKEFSK
ncbi:noc3p [Saccharomyces arboricola H-6]|uniref:Nucleolar complex-associated protein 3 n=1 Tax=Saccharomyces arboricola (strain H-6 / AS 2.3317 / CBS 10644) TaxID=1160507 RepID=J8Q276_SACAR|nr:noc3p [Saccharomyces arboricola H-6]